MQMECVVELCCEVDCMYMSSYSSYHLEKQFLANFLNILYTVYTPSKKCNK